MPRSASVSSSSSPVLAIDGDGDHLRLEGELRIPTLEQARQLLKQWLTHSGRGTLNLARLQGLDTPGALLLCELRGDGVELTGLRPDHAALLELICGLELKPLPALPKPARWRQLVMQLGKGAEDAWHATIDIVTFLGRISSVVRHVLRHPSALRPAAISRHVAQTGIEALPIVGLMAVLISVVIGYQGVAQLRPYGGEDFTINLVAVSVLREMGVLITAIMVAGRSGSAFTAEIGVMKAREEVDALDAMGLDAMELLVLPRLIGLVIALPLLTFFADMMGLAGGAMIAQTLLHVSPDQYLERVRHAVDASDLFVGLIKAPVFAVFIGIVGCMHGLRVRGSAESVGQETTRAVVKSIFLVITLDAGFSVLFERLGL